MEANFLPGVSSHLDSLFRRNCVECPPITPSCPNCPSGQVCVQTNGDCTKCPSRRCIPEAQSGANDISQPPPPPPSKGPNIGAIAGGVVGGVVFIAVAVAIIYWFWIRRRRQSWEAEQAQYDHYSDKSSERSARTRASMASTTRTRGSNVIQIAFIPGVTERAGEGFTPPVPPIPSSQASTPYTDHSSPDHYFMPGDLRDSTYSGFTDDGASTIDRRSIATRSIAPSIAPSLLRHSFASTVYHEDAIANPMPAQTAQMWKANVVSVKSSAAPSRAPSVPAVPTIDRSKYGPSSAGGLSANTAPGVMAGGLGITPTSAQPGPQASQLPSIHVTSDGASEMSVDAISMRSGAPEVKNAIQEATWRASQQPRHGGLGSVRSNNHDPSPFSDRHRVSEGSDGSASP